jgi:glycine/D-amino acid oxidase-like deaminating enzyme
MAAEVLVIGGGMAGLSAAYQLRDWGERVRLVERDVLVSPQASSHGQSRMYREMYSDPYLCARSREANAMWRDLEARHRIQLRRQHGLLFYGESWDEETIEGSIPGARRVMDAQRIPYQALSAEQIRRRFPLRPDPSFQGLFEPTAGAILSDRVLALFADEARRAGVRIDEGLGVINLRPKGGGGARVRFEDGSAGDFERVLVCAGAWAPRLVPGLDALKAWSMLWAHYAVDEELADRYPQWFCFQQSRGEDGGLYYGFPVLHRIGGHPVIKAGIDWAPRQMQHETVEALPPAAEPRMVELLDDFMARGLEGVGPRLETFVSPYAMSPDVQFVLDEVEPGIAVFTGGSGQAFKFAPLIGALLADLARGDGPRCDLGPWRAERLAA